MDLMRYNPLDAFETETPRRFSDILDDFFSDALTWNGNNTFSPRVNVSEDENSYHLEIALPGMKKKDVKIDLKSNQLTISGERKFEDKKEGVRYHLVENGYGKFNRTFTLTEDVDRDSIDARFEDGLLIIDLNKSAKALSKQIEIK